MGLICLTYVGELADELDIRVRISCTSQQVHNSDMDGVRGRNGARTQSRTQLVVQSVADVMKLLKVSLFRILMKVA